MSSHSGAVKTGLAIMKCTDCQGNMRPVVGLRTCDRGVFKGSWVCPCGKSLRAEDPHRPLGREYGYKVCECVGRIIE